MNNMILDDKLLYAVIGLGETGFSVVKFLAKRNYQLLVVDSRQKPPRLQDFMALNTARLSLGQVPIALELGDFNLAVLAQADVIVLSPGIALTHPVIKQLIVLNKPVISDIEVFAQLCKSKVVAITGSNGKSTTTAMFGEAAQACGMRIFVGGNIGVPILDLLDEQGEPQDNDLFVLELSSFHLQMTYSLQLEAAAILNITPNHLDRHSDFIEYKEAKHKIYSFAKNIVFNRDDIHTYQDKKNEISFALDLPSLDKDFGFNAGYLTVGKVNLMANSNLKLLGEHNIANALAVLALGVSMGLPIYNLLQGIVSFKGLAHRCQLIKNENNILWINDSKASTVEACLATVSGISATIIGKIVLIAGGSDKGTAFDDMLLLAPKLRVVILLGQTAPKIAAVLEGKIRILRVTSLEEAVRVASEVAQPGDAVMLSPACASLDMFNNFMERGDKFILEVQKESVEID